MLKGYKTIIVNALLLSYAVFKVVVPDSPNVDPREVVTHINNLDSLLVAGAAVVNMALRAVTTSPVFKKD